MNDEYDWRTGRSCVYQNYYHLVFVTKYRKGVFTDEMLTALEAVFEETCEQMDCKLIECNGEPDHVHLLVTCPPKLAVANLVGKLKGKSSFVLRRDFGPLLRKKLWGDHLWSPSYASVTCGGAPLEIVKKYIDDQKRPPSQKGIEISTRENTRNSPGGKMPGTVARR